MLQSLHVKNLALIDEAEVDFTRDSISSRERPVRVSPSSSVRSIWRWVKKCKRKC